jgi:hypothetical protein
MQLYYINGPGWPGDSNQIRPIFQKAAKTVAKPKKAKIFISKIHIKPSLKRNKPCFKTA